MREHRALQRRRRLQVQLFAVAAAVVLLLGGGTYVYRSPAFSIERVEVVGNHRLTAEQVRDLAAVPADATLLRYPGAEVESRLREYPWIASATLSRDFPDGLKIRITERTPAALVDLGKAAWVVDPSGHVLERFSGDTKNSLVVVRRISGVKPKVGRSLDSDALRNALAVLRGISDDLRSSVRSVSAPEVDETSLITQDGVEILFGSAEKVEKKDLIAREIMAQQKGKVVFIDVRPDRPVWRGLGK